MSLSIHHAWFLVICPQEELIEDLLPRQMQRREAHALDEKGKAFVAPVVSSHSKKKKYEGK